MRLRFTIRDWRLSFECGKVGGEAAVESLPPLSVGSPQGLQWPKTSAADPIHRSQMKVKGKEIMKVGALVLSLLMLIGVSPVLGQIPDCYHHVDSVDWVVPSLDGVLDGWRKLGFAVEELGPQTLQGQDSNGQPVSIEVKLARGNLAGFWILWIEPVSSKNIYTDYLNRRGAGVLSLNYRLDSPEALRKETSRMANLGAAALQKASVKEAGSIRTTVYLDTAADGRAGIALVDYSTPVTPLACSTAISFRPSQYAFIVHDLEPVSAYWKKLGFGEMEITHGALGDLVYRGQPGVFDQRLGWQRHSDITYEWIQPLKGPTVYNEAMKTHGEGFHHFAFDVQDMDQAIAFFKAKGLAVSQSGSWGEKGKPGSGRFAYIDTDAIGGVTLELLWNYRE